MNQVVEFQMKKVPNPIKSFVQSELKKQGKSQADLAKLLNKTPSNFSHNLDSGSLTQDDMKVIARFLNIDLSFLNDGSQIKSPGAFLQKVENVEKDDKVKSLEELIKAKDEALRRADDALKRADEALRTKDELISTLKELKHKRE